jgi:hypothetical protein
MVDFSFHLQQKAAETPILTLPCLSVLLSTCNNTSRTYKQSFVRLLLWNLLKYVDRLWVWLNFDIHNRMYSKTYLHFCICLELSSPSMYQSENISNKSCRENWNTFCTPYACCLCMQVYYPMFWLSLQAENVATGNDHFVNTSSVSCDEENVKVRNSSKFIRSLIETCCFCNTFFITVYCLPKLHGQLM